MVIRVGEGVDDATGRMMFRDYVGHVLASSSTAIDLSRDPAANGSRPKQRVRIPIESIVAIKPVPERRHPTPPRTQSPS